MSVKLVQKINTLNIDWGNYNSCGTNVNSNKKEDISIYPNPAQNQIFIANLPAGANYKVVNQLGQTVLEGNSNNCSIENLNAGIYSLIIISQSKITSTSFVKM
jgi:hypothetical protein